MAKSKIPLNPPLEKGEEPAERTSSKKKKAGAASKTAKSNEGLQEVQQKADGYLEEIALRKGELEALQKEYDEALKALTDQYSLQIAAYQALLDGAVKALMQTMKYNKVILFSSADVVNLAHGSLIRNAGEKVTIPHGALQSCKDQGFQDVIKIAESLDREAIEKWPEDKLALIGAKKKPSEEFKYDLRENGVSHTTTGICGAQASPDETRPAQLL